ncbi:unnamed protein product [Lampetra planeri]
MNISTENLAVGAMLAIHTCTAHLPALPLPDQRAASNCPGAFVNCPRGRGTTRSGEPARKKNGEEAEAGGGEEEEDAADDDEGQEKWKERVYWCLVTAFTAPMYSVVSSLLTRSELTVRGEPRGRRQGHAPLLKTGICESHGDIGLA